MQLKFNNKIAILICVFSLLISSNTVFAGSINDNEASVLSVARGTFEYKGEMYAANQQYVNQLVAKLSQDDVNLTKEQASEAISNIYGNIEKGVKEGYISKVSGGNNTTESDDTKQDNSKNTTKDTSKNDNTANQASGDAKNAAENNSNDQTGQSDNSVVNKTYQESKAVTAAPIEAQNVIKNTGFSLYPSIIVLMIILITLVGCVVYIIKNKLIVRHSS